VKVENAKPKVGATVTIDRGDFLSGKYALEIQQLLVERSALVFPGMFLDDKEQLQFARTIGEVFLVGGDKELQNISMDPAINPVADYTRGAFYWHIDGAGDPIPAKATMLSVRTMPAEGEGGDTLVANTYAAYADLPDEEKHAIDRIRVRHALEASQRFITPNPTVAELTRWQSHPSRTHPLVWHHRHGRPSLLLGNTCHYVEDMELAEGNMLLCRLLEWATQDEYVYRHTWQEGDFLLFDNTGAMHRADWYPYDSKRLMRRTTLVGEEPVTAAFEPA
jgi:alpha-ketoglutarate-dependent taurine dioxygenase